MRAKPERFADHYTQAKLFYASQSPIEQAHILRGFRFELTKVEVPAIRERVVALLANVDVDLAGALARDLGMSMPKALPRALEKPRAPELAVSPALSIFSQPGDGSIRTRRVAILVADGVDGAEVELLRSALAKEGAVPRRVGARLGAVVGLAGDAVAVDVTFEAMPSVLFDAVAVPDGEEAATALAGVGNALEFVRDQFRHNKPILASGAGATLLEHAGASPVLPSGEPDPGVLVAADGVVDAVIEAFRVAIAEHRHYERALDPPEV